MYNSIVASRTASFNPRPGPEAAGSRERDLKTRDSSCDRVSGQRLLHQEEMGDAFVQAIDRSPALPVEPEAMEHGQLQETLEGLVREPDAWMTLAAT